MPSIINSDDGQTSGSAGLKFTSSDDGILQIQNNGTTAMTVSASGQPTFAAPVSQPGAFMFRNKLINGNFDIWQRDTSQTSSNYGSADRWQCVNVGSTKTASQQAFALGQTDVPNNPKYFMRHVVSNVAGAGNYVFVTQKIEGVETLSGRTATLSFWAKADASKNMAVEFVQYFGTGGSPSDVVTGIGSQLVALTTSWTKYTITVDIPSVSGKTKGTNGNDILQVFFWFDAGSDFDVRTINLGQQSGTFDIAQIQLEEGSAATPFEQRPIQTEHHLCFRYYQKSYSIDTKIGTVTNAGAINILTQATSSYHQMPSIRLGVPMRIPPSVTIYNPSTGGSGTIRGSNGTNYTGYSSTLGNQGFNIGVSNITVAGNIGLFAQWVADAEL